MGLLSWLVVGGIAHVIISSGEANSNYDEYMAELELKRQQREDEVKRRLEEDLKRRNTPCQWIGGISQSDFRKLAVKHAKDIKRLWVDGVEGPYVKCTVKSSSGISSWCFEVDFNDWGFITGTYKIYRDNYDSSIPSIYAEKLSSNVKYILEHANISEDERVRQKRKRWRTMDRCQYCGEEFKKVLFGMKCSGCKKKKDYKIKKRRYLT